MATVGVSSLGRVRLPAVLLALALLGAGCASERKAEPQRPQTPPAALRPPPKPKPKPKRSKVHVIVFDGDTGAPVRGAVVHVGRFGGRTDHHGVAKIRIARHARLQVQVAKRGYDGFSQRLQFRNRPKVGVRVYQAKLQWTRYGATAGRTQSHPLIRIRPPFREVWSQAVGLMEFPAVVDADVAFVANYQASVRAFSMRNGKPVWRHDFGGIMAASPAVVGEDVVVHAMNGHVYVLDRHNGRIRWSYRTGAPIESSPLVVNGVDYFGDWSGTVWALDLRTHRARWTYRSGYEDHLERLLRRRDDLHRRLRGPPARPLAEERRPALVGVGQRPGLRHSRDRERARLRAQLDRRLADRLLDPRRASLVARHRDLRLRLAGGLERPRLHRLLQRLPLLPLGR